MSEFTDRKERLVAFVLVAQYRIIDCFCTGGARAALAAGKEKE